MNFVCKMDVKTFLFFGSENKFFETTCDLKWDREPYFDDDAIITHHHQKFKKPSFQALPNFTKALMNSLKLSHGLLVGNHCLKNYFLKQHLRQI